MAESPDDKNFLSHETAEFTDSDHWRVFKIMSEFVQGFDSLSAIGPAITIFGSARTPQDHPEYKDAVMRKFVIVVLILVAIPVVLFQLAFPSISYRYRLTVAVEVDGQIHAGSTVIGLSHQFSPKILPDASTYSESVSGQAALIDLGTRGVLVVALGGPDYRCDVQAGHLLGRAYEPAATRRPCEVGYPRTLENERALARMKGSIDLTPDNMPAFIWFSNKADPATAHFVKPQAFASVIGDSTRLVSAKVQITHDPIVIDIDKKLPLYNSLPPPAEGSKTLKLPNGQYLNWGMFIAPGSVWLLHRFPV
jgi:hypothetical protein